MSATFNRREGAIIGFFWMVTVVVALMTVVNLARGPSDKPRQQAQAPNTAAIEARIAQLEARLKAVPGDVEAMVALGDLYLETQRVMEGFRLFQRAVEIEPSNVHALSDLGGLYQQLGQSDKALESYRRAYESKPDHSAPLLNMALIYSRDKGDNAKALELLRRFLASNPEAQLIATAQQEIARIEQAMKEAGGASPNTPPTRR
ncbi:MAG: tetratricopeptide repeat protein [Deltaproteobacteria bacterium]|nr:tetratricopeptide repeat protein [Deltaproteobacteria bacterium]